MPRERRGRADDRRARRHAGELEYYEAQVAAGAEDYYAGRGESPGRWRGRGAELIGLPVGRRVQRGEFMRLMQGRHPLNGQVLREMGARSTVAGFDLTFSAPKTVSILFAIGDDSLSGTLLAAHEHAVDEALAHLEREACFTRRGRDGTDRVRGDGFIAAGYRHRMSRAGDPQLHTHVVVGNLTRADGRYTVLDARALYEHKFCGRRRLPGGPARGGPPTLPWVAWRPAGRGLTASRFGADRPKRSSGVGRTVISGSVIGNVRGGRQPKRWPQPPRRPRGRADRSWERTMRGTDSTRCSRPAWFRTRPQEPTGQRGRWRQARQRRAQRFIGLQCQATGVVA